MDSSAGQGNEGGGLGFNLYGYNDVLLHSRHSSTPLRSAGHVNVNQPIVKIIFLCSGNGVYIYVTVTNNGVAKQFKCTNCWNSESDNLYRLYTDTDMNGPMSAPGLVKCKDTCTFEIVGM